MKKSIWLAVFAVLLLLLGYGLGYRNGFSQARKGTRVFIGRDASDHLEASEKASYEPYFTRQNLIPDKVK
jgi:hypothetical protein